MGTGEPTVRLNGAALRAIRSRTVDPHTGRVYSGVRLAEAAGIQQPHLSLLERDLRDASQTTLQRLATALDVPPAALMWAPPARETTAKEAVA